MRFSGKALVIGGMNADILGVPAGPFRPGDSLPGSIRLSAGGVGFNIASWLAKAGAQVQFITAFGEDSLTALTESACAAAGLDVSLSLRLPGPSPIYLAIHADDGTVAAAINDMAAILSISPEHLEAQRKKLISPIDVCVIDANLPQDTLSAIPGLVKAPLLADPVSCEKGLRLLPVLSRLSAIKPNAAEAMALSGCPEIPAAARWLVDRGVRQVFISMGSEGLYYASRQEAGHLPADAITISPSTGAGDAMCAGLALGLAQGMPVTDTARLGLEAAACHLNNKAWER